MKTIEQSDCCNSTVIWGNGVSYCLECGSWCDVIIVPDTDKHEISVKMPIETKNNNELC